MNRNSPAPGFSQTPRFDVAIVGGGIVGLATAMALLERGHPSLVVIEAEKQLAAHQTGHNSGVIHSGLYYKPGSLKARLCVEGREALYRFCAEHGIACERCGKIVVATDHSEMPALEALCRRGTANGLAGLRVLSIQELREHEPHVAGVGGLRVSETGIVDFAEVARGYARVVQSRGGQVMTDTRLLGVLRRERRIILRTTRGDIACGMMVNCGGLQSDRIARMCGLRPAVRIVPFRCEYYRLSPAGSALVRNLIYPVPDPAFPFLGVHFTRMIGGGVEAGPNAVPALSRHGYSWSQVNGRDLLDAMGFVGTWRLAGRYWRTGLAELYRSLSRRAYLKALQRLLPAVQLEHLQPGGAGVRAQALGADGRMVDDFRIESAPGMVHVLNAPSPAATASIAIGRYIAEEVVCRRLGSEG